MKRILGITIGTLCLFCLLFVGVTPQDSLAALTKSTAWDTIDAWQPLAVATMAVGNSEDISGSYDTIVYIEMAYTGAAAQAGVDIIVEISSGTADDWTQLTTFKSPGGVTPNLDDLDEGSNTLAGDTTIDLTSETGYTTVGQLWFIVDTTVAESEILRVKSISGQTITLAQDAKYAHSDAEVTTNSAYQWAVHIPFAAAYVRTLINNTDADATLHWRSHCSKVTSIQ